MEEYPVCARPGCNDPLKYGDTYCSNRCAALDRRRRKAILIRDKRLSSETRQMVPLGLREMVLTHVGGDGAEYLLEEIAITLAEEKTTAAPPLLSRLTESGDTTTNRYGVLRLSTGKVYRPNDLLSYDTIEDMMRSGSVLFALELKRAFIRSVLRNERSISVVCENERMRKVVQGIMVRTLRRYADEMLECIPYGASFFEKEWDYQPAVTWGIGGIRGQVYGYRSLKSVHPKSVDHIKYKDNGHTFDGFVQNVQLKPNSKVPVPADLALVMTYDKKWRNLWGNPATDPMYPYWFCLEIITRSFIRYLERAGTPVAVAKAPGKGKVTMPDGTKMENMKAAQLLAGYAAKSNAIAMPSDFDEDTGHPLWSLEYLADDKRGDQFVRAMEIFGTLLNRAAIMGDQAATQGSVGSYAASRVHMEATQMHNEKILDNFLEQINDHLVRQIVQYNGSSRTAPAHLETEGLDPVERDNLFKLISIVGNQADSFAMKRIDWEEVFSVNNIPFLTIEETEELVDAEIERTTKRNEALAESAPQKPTPTSPQGKKPPKPETQEKVKQSLDWILYKLAGGATVPIILSTEQARDLVDRLTPRPTTFDMGQSLAEDDDLDEQIDQIVAEIMAGLGEDVDEATREKIRAYVLSLLGFVERGKELEDIEFDVVEMSKVGDFLKGLAKKAKGLLDRAVKKITGKDLGEWKRAIRGKKSGRYSGAASTKKATVTRKDGSSYEWDPDKHPRDEKGRWAKKGNEGTKEPPPEEEKPSVVETVKKVVKVVRTVATIADIVGNLKPGEGVPVPFGDSRVSEIANDIATRLDLPISEIGVRFVDGGFNGEAVVRIGDKDVKIAVGGKLLFSEPGKFNLILGDVRIGKIKAPSAVIKIVSQLIAKAAAEAGVDVESTATKKGQTVIVGSVPYIKNIEFVDGEAIVEVYLPSQEKE